MKRIVKFLFLAIYVIFDSQQLVVRLFSNILYTHNRNRLVEKGKGRLIHKHLS